MDDDPTRLSYWFPLIEAAGLPVPRTRIVRVSPEDMALLYPFCLDGEGDPAVWRRLIAAIEAAARELPGPPWFLRTDYTSGKHSWKDTCYIPDLDDLPSHVSKLVEYSELCDMMGRPWDVWVVREFLKTRPCFHAFDGQMPITREFRYFVRDGVIESFQPYWPAFAIEGHFYDRPEPEGWRETLARMSHLHPADMDKLDDMTLAASAAVPGFWSVDWLETEDRGFVLCDMAEGEKSFRYDPDEPQE